MTTYSPLTGKLLVPSTGANKLEFIDPITGESYLATEDQTLLFSQNYKPIAELTHKVHSEAFDPTSNRVDYPAGCPNCGARTVTIYVSRNGQESYTCECTQVWQL